MEYNGKQSKPIKLLKEVENTTKNEERRYKNMRVGLIMWEKKNGLKGSFIAEKIGVSDSTWSKIKSGKQNPTLEQVEKLRSEFGLDNILDLLKEGENAENESGCNVDGVTIE